MAEQIIRAPTFHEHLEKCRQCRERPFDLCPYGAKALRREAMDILLNPAGLRSEGEK